MLAIQLLEIQVAVGGRPCQPISPLDYVTKITQDSKEVEQGTLFVALRGNHVDGHNFLSDVKKAGAIAAIVEYKVPNVDIQQFIVPSTVEALGNLSKIWKGRLNLQMIAVTGSVGKTSTKDMIAHVLSAKYNTHKSRKNFNNQLGVPLELLKLDRKHECSVIEFGMRGANQINYLSKIARPNFAVITNIGMSHIEKLGTRENIAKAKAEIFEGMDSEGYVILNADDEYFDFIKKMSKCSIISFGENRNADIRISDIQLNQKGNPTFRLNGLPITMTESIGKHHAYNAAIAFAIGSKLGVRPEDIAEKITTYTTPERRGTFSIAACGATLLDSTYNAAPDSIKASLYTLAELKKRGNRTIAVIGEMLELGNFSEEAHKHIGKTIATMNNIDLLITVGEYAKFIGEESKVANWKHFIDSSSATLFMLDEIKHDDMVLLQGSNSISLDIVVNALEKGMINDINR